jgi:hypothetical protein
MDCDIKKRKENVEMCSAQRVVRREQNEKNNRHEVLQRSESSIEHNKYPYYLGVSPRESRIHADQARKKMPRNTRSAKQTEDFPASNEFK